MRGRQRGLARAAAGLKQAAAEEIYGGGGAQVGERMGERQVADEGSASG